MSTAAATKRKRINQSAAYESIAPAKVRVDREKGIIYHVKILGHKSRNSNGTYPKEAMESAVKRGIYEGALVNTNHPDRDNPGKDRDVFERFGKIKNVVLESDPETGEPGLYGDLHYLRAFDPHKLAHILEACENQDMSDTLGLSHNAVTRKKFAQDGSVTHESIERVRSIDLVADPATTNGIYESECPTMEDTTLTPTTEEKVGGMPTDTGTTDPLTACMDAFCQQTMDIFHSDDDPKKKIADFKDLVMKSEKLKEILGGGEEEEEPEEEEETETESVRVLQQEVRQLKTKTRLQEAGIAKPTAEQVAATSSLESEVAQDALIKTWTAGTAGTPKPKPTSRSSSGTTSLESAGDKKTPSVDFYAMATSAY